jgi:hypothetical protein
VQLTPKQKVRWVDSKQLTDMVFRAVYLTVNGKVMEKLPSQPMMENAIRRELKGVLRWNQLEFRWPSRELAVAETLMESEDPTFVTLIVRPWKAKKMTITYRRAEVGICATEEEEFYPEDSGSTYVDPVGEDYYDADPASEYNQEFDKRWERAFSQAPNRRPDLDDWEWKFAKKWARSRRA